jgi:hypothetical protein
MVLSFTLHSLAELVRITKVVSQDIWLTSALLHPESIVLQVISNFLMALNV